MTSHVNQQFAGRRHFGMVLGEQCSGTGVFLNDCRTIDSFTRSERFPPVYGAIHGIGVENHGAFPYRCRTSARLSCG